MYYYKVILIGELECSKKVHHKVVISSQAADKVI